MKINQNDNQEKKRNAKAVAKAKKNNEQLPEANLFDEENFLEPKKETIYLMIDTNKPLFPGIVFSLMFAKGIQVESLRAAYTKNRKLGFILTGYEEIMKSLQKAEDEPENVKEALKKGKSIMKRELAKTGTVARIMRFEELPDGNARGIFKGMRRFVLKKVYVEEGCLKGDVEYVDDIEPDLKTGKALILQMMSQLNKMVKLAPLYGDELHEMMNHSDNRQPGNLADLVASLMSISPLEMQLVLDELDVAKRIRMVLEHLDKEIQTYELKEQIRNEVEAKLSKQQHDFVLREQLRYIKEQLGYEKNDTPDEDRYREILDEIKDDIPEEVAKKIKSEISKLSMMNPQSPEYTVTRNYLDCLTGLPWNTLTEDKLDVARAQKVLDRDHYGLDDVKKRIVEFIGVSKLKGVVDGSIICLVGPPGVGKTSLGRSIADALGRKFFRFSLGGMRDEAEIKGHRRTYIGALPGKVIEAIRICGSKNPVIMLDEIDKLGKSFQGDPASALLEVLDPEQNSSFRDHYLDVPFDLSKVMFIATANVQDTIPSPLLDRMEVINLSGYVTEEKLQIAKKHLVPKQLPRNGLTKSNVTFTMAGLRAIANNYAREAGVRAMEKSIVSIMRKIATDIASGKQSPDEKVTIKPDTVEKYLGKPKFVDDDEMKELQVGVARGLAWTAMGGATLYIEAVSVPGSGDLRLTGQLGDVMKESIRIASTVLEANAKEFGMMENYFKDNTIHLHVPAGATPKDGPSAGITMAAAMLSLARGQTISNDWAMTGELTLKGRVLPVGGIKEKTIAATRTGVKNIIMPKSNEKDFDEIPQRVKQGLNVHYVENIQEVFGLLFH